MKILWAIPGAFFLVLGIIGLILPVIPQIPFLIISLFCFCKVSEQLKNRVESHPLYLKYLDFGGKKVLPGKA